MLMALLVITSHQK